MDFKTSKDFNPPCSDYKYFSVIWFKKGVRGHQIRSFSQLDASSAFEFARDLMLDDDNNRIHIIETRYYYFKERNIES